VQDTKKPHSSIGVGLVFVPGVGSLSAAEWTSAGRLRFGRSVIRSAWSVLLVVLSFVRLGFPRQVAGLPIRGGKPYFWYRDGSAGDDGRPPGRSRRSADHV